MRLFIFFIWLFIGIINIFFSEGDISKETYFLCWGMLMIELLELVVIDGYIY